MFAFFKNSSCWSYLDGWGDVFVDFSRAIISVVNCPGWVTVVYYETNPFYAVRHNMVTWFTNFAEQSHLFAHQILRNKNKANWNTASKFLSPSGPGAEPFAPPIVLLAPPGRAPPQQHDLDNSHALKTGQLHVLLTVSRRRFDGYLFQR